MADSGDFSDKNGSHRVLKSNSTSDSLKATSPRSSSLDTSTDGGDMITLWEPPWSSDALVAVARFWEAWEAYVENVSNSDESVHFCWRPSIWNAQLAPKVVSLQ